MNIDVCTGNQLVKDFAVFAVLGVQGDAALVAVIGLKVRAVQTALEGAEGVSAVGRFDLDDVGTQIGQQHARSRSGDERALLDDLDALQDFDHLTASPVYCSSRVA